MSDVDFPGMFAALKIADAAFRATPGTRTLFALLKAGAAIRAAGGTVYPPMPAPAEPPSPKPTE